MTAINARTADAILDGYPLDADDATISLCKKLLDHPHIDEMAVAFKPALTMVLTMYAKTQRDASESGAAWLEQMAAFGIPRHVMHTVLSIFGDEEVAAWA